MSTNLPTKTSSRAGRFKKKLVSAEVLLAEAPQIEARLAPVVDLFHQKKISPAEFTGLYVLSILSLRFPGTWLGAKQIQSGSHNLNYPLSECLPLWEPNIQRRLKDFKTLGDVFQNFGLKSTPQSVNRSLLSWSRGEYGLELMFRIPTPAEVLEQQKKGRRCVTVLTEARRISQFILGERDALSFTMHDLIHADHFYHDNALYEGQLGFYGFLDFCLKEGHFEELLENKKFEDEFEYLIADMNAYAIHLFKCFKSALIHYHPLKDAYFQQWLGLLDLGPHEAEAMSGLNTPSYTVEDDSLILGLLARHRVK